MAKKIGCEERVVARLERLEHLSSANFDRPSRMPATNAPSTASTPSHWVATPRPSTTDQEQLRRRPVVAAPTDLAEDRVEDALTDGEREDEEDRHAADRGGERADLELAGRARPATAPRRIQPTTSLTMPAASVS